MKNPATHIRRSLYNLLKDQIVHDGIVVPVFEGSGVVGLKKQILIRDYSDSDNSNKTNFRYNGNQLIEIVTERNDDTSKEVDEIAELAMDKIQPNPKTLEVLSNNIFQVFTDTAPSKNLLQEAGQGTTVITRRLLRYNMTIIER